MLWVRIATDNLHIAANARRGRVARFVLHDRAVNLLKHRIVNIRSEGVLNRIQIDSVTVSGDLHAVLDSTGAVLHKLFRPTAITTAD